MGSKARVFLNPKSGAGKAAPEHLEELFGREGVSAAITRLTAGVDLKKLNAADAADVAWVAAGGDGTIRAVAEAIAGSDRAFGVLALGTLNHFARDLDLPLELEAAVQGIAAGQTAAVDAAEVRCGKGGVSAFVNNSSLGAYPAMVMDRERMKRAGRNKWSSLVVASVKAFVRFRCLTVTFAVDGHERRCTTPFLFVGNNEYCVDGARLGRREHLDRGTLSLYLAPGASRATMLRFVTAAALGRLKDLPEFHEYKTTEFTVDARRRKRLRVSLDGEVKRLTGPLTYRIRPSALQVLKQS